MANLSTEPVIYALDHLQCQPTVTSQNQLQNDINMSALPAPEEPEDPFHKPQFPSHLPNIHDWTPFPARVMFVCLFIRWILCNIITLVVLWALSQSREGLAINLQHKDVLFVWHFVPTAIAMANNLGFSAIGSASLICQPYLNQLQERGTSAKESLTLDYSEPLPRMTLLQTVL